MKTQKQAMALAWLILAVLATTGCSPDSASQPPTTAKTPETPAMPEARPETKEIVSELAGTSWQLVRIMGMDDSVAEPDDRSLYTLEFGEEGRAVLRADCNRGNGTWTSESAGQLLFGPIASTRAMCPPGSISDQYLAQFEWVRSYVLKDGHLFLATMADGSIIEFEPLALEPLAATVLGEDVRTAEPAEMQQVIISRLLDRFATENGILVTDDEIEAFVQKMRQGMADEGLLDSESELTEEEAAQVDTMQRDMAKSIIRQWKLNRALYSQFGGRIIYQQLGPEPLDAYRIFLEEQQQAGDFTIHDPSFTEAFWNYFTNDSIHDFMAPGSADEARAFATPPWEQAEENS